MNDNAVREIVYNLSENTITLYSHGPQGFERVLTAREVAETIEHFPANATVIMNTNKRY